MTKKNDIVIKPLTPYIELVLWTFITVAGLFSIYRVIQPTRESIWYFTTTVFLISTIQLTRLINSRFKRILITNDNVLISSYLKPWRTELNRKMIKGYNLSEVYHGQGTIFIIRLLTLDNRTIDILRDGYKNYEKVKELIDNSGIGYLGRTELPNRNKKLFNWFMTWGLYVIPLTIILILYLVKSI